MFQVTSDNSLVFASLLWTPLFFRLSRAVCFLIMWRVILQSGLILHIVPTKGRLNTVNWLNLLHTFILLVLAIVRLYSSDVSCMPLSPLSILTLLAKPSTQIYIWKVFAKSLYTRVFMAKRVSACSILWQAVINAIHYYCNLWYLRNLIS